nr:MAG TPA: hypothetical protein [Caudoviricetes sp.]
MQSTDSRTECRWIESLTPSQIRQRSRKQSK